MTDVRITDPYVTEPYLMEQGMTDPYVTDPADVPAAIERIIISEQEIAAKIAELAAAIDADYVGREILLVGVLKGAVMVMADLARALRTPVSMEFMAVSSYGSWLLRNLQTRGPASVQVCALLRKPEAAKAAVDVRYVGFDIGNAFVVGYGLDHAERYRDLPFVGLLRPEAYT